MCGKVNVAEPWLVFHSYSFSEVNRYNECKSVVTDARNLEAVEEVIILRNSTAKLQKNKSDYFWKLLIFQNLTLILLLL